MLHSPFYTCPLRAGCPVTVTVHDATFFTEPEHYDNTKRTFFRSAIKTSLRRAARVIVPSKATRDELIRLLDADPTRIDVAYHGVDPTAFHAPTEEEKARVRARLGLGDSDYVAFLGAKEPRKNVPNLIRGWARAVADWPRPPALVIAGGQGHDDEIDRAVVEVPSHLRLAPAGLPAVRRPARLPRRRAGRRVPVLRGGVRPADPGGDGLRHAGADHARGCRCPRSAATRSRTRPRTRTGSPRTWPTCCTTSRAG